jgi:hypothetical protein
MKVYAVSDYAKVHEFILDLAIQYNIGVADVVTLLQLVRDYADGKPIMVPPRTGSRWTSVVPDPSDPSIDFHQAWLDAQRDAVIGFQLLMSNPTFEEILDVELNAYRWLRFLAVRCPDPGWRIIYEGTADDTAYGWKRRRAECETMNNSKAKLVLERLHP